MYYGKTLVVFFCMHRSGSSFVAQLFQRLGMSLGPFDLLGAQESNPHGHFEAVPFVALNREIQLQSFGFSEDRPVQPGTLRRLRESGGRWPADAKTTNRHHQEGKRLIEQLVASGTVSGFKDPRTVLTWPFWENVLRDFAGLRIVPVFLLRSPHEIAMSLFRRADGEIPYDEALDLAAVHYRRMRWIYDAWQGDRCVLQFEPAIFAHQSPAVAAMCGLKWDDAAFADTFDSHCRHHVPAMVDHEAQTLFEQLGGSSDGRSPCDNLHQLMADATEREQILYSRYKMAADAEVENRATRNQLASCTAELRRLEAERVRWEVDRRQIEANLRALQAEKAVWDEYQRSRGWALLQTFWRLRQLLVPKQSRREVVTRTPLRWARLVMKRVKGILFL